MKNAPKTTIHVTGIPQSLDRADLKSMFSKFEGFVRICFHSDYIFVSFTEVAYAGKAIEIIHNTTDMLASYAKFGATPINSPSISVQPNPILYIRCSHMISIFPHFTEQELLKIFKSYEGFDSARFFSSHCLVRYRDVECAKRVLEDLNATTNLFANYSTKGTKKVQASNTSSLLNGRHSVNGSPSITASTTATSTNTLTMINNAAANGMYTLTNNYNSDSDNQSNAQSTNSNTLYDDEIPEKPNIDFQPNKIFDRRGSYSSNASNNSSYYANSSHGGRSNSMSHNTSQPKRTLHVTNFNKTKNQLRSIFASFPGFKKVAFYQDYCFVIFSDAEAASNASEELLFKTKLKVSYAKADYVPYVVSASAIGTPNNVIRAADYPNSTTESELAEMFNSYPGFMDLKFSKNYSIVYFQDVNTAKVALEDMNKTTNFTLTYLKKSNNKYNNMNNLNNNTSTNTTNVNSNNVNNINTNINNVNNNTNNNNNNTNTQNSNINSMGLLSNYPNNGTMPNLPNIHNFQNVPNYQNIKNGLKNQRNNISVFQRMPNLNMNSGKGSPSSTTPSAVLPSIATSLPLKSKDSMSLPVTSSQLLNGIDINNSPSAKINPMLFNDVTGNYNNAVMNQNNYIQNSTSQLLGVNNNSNNSNNNNNNNNSTNNKVNEKSVLFTGRYDDIMGQDQNSLFSLTLGSSGKSSPCSSIGSPISSPSYSPTISANGFLNNDSPVTSIKSLSLNQPSYKSTYTTNFGPSIWSTASTSSMSDIGSSNLPDYNPKVNNNSFSNIITSSNTLNELDLHSKAITPPISSSIINESSFGGGIIGSNRSILENGRTTRSKSESFAFQGIINDINNAVYSSEMKRKKSAASSIYDEIIGNDLMEPMRPLSASSSSPKSTKPSLSKHTIIEENSESDKLEGKNNELNISDSGIKKSEEVKKSKEFVNFFSDTVSTVADSLSKNLEEYKQTSNSPSTLVADTNDIEVSTKDNNKKSEIDNTTSATTSNNTTNNAESTDAIKNQNKNKIDSYEKSQAYIQLESQCNQFKTVVDNLISKLLSLQRENDILLNDKNELLQFKSKSQQEIDELKLENSLLKNELQLKNTTASNSNTNNNHALKENIQNENSYMMNNF
ncbi:hypothetical protein BCR32DRAFT_244806 [Anaeromyces robustus]|uniref:RRM domain-containing protein n=1 Tax=Anaeromyces robustus TaxID=1754192 RepID=A0A1Y1X7E2_9FUNG|nr:hypothetical protein BCR32DRAFT_244806 [Anaeromyces robustus]|eukprot:ORX81608.1 hypothetical protein BCR32DRAFT_244806 [Anaeromyces robustus]